MGAVICTKSPSPAQIVLNLPVPPSVNKFRRIDRRGDKARAEYYLRTDLFLTAYGPRPAPVRIITGAYEIRIQIPENLSRLDLDNHCKAILDYLVSREIVPDDSKRYLRRLVVEWGSPTSACHITIKGIES
jgi:Holliday junction resolvase RusA-like endonuclease